MANWFAKWDPSKAGQIGDTFGAVNALFSGLAFAGVFYILYEEQRERVNAQKRDLTLRCFERLMNEDTQLAVVEIGRPMFEGRIDHAIRVRTVLEMVEELLLNKQLDQDLARTLLARKLCSWREAIAKTQIPLVTFGGVGPEPGLREQVIVLIAKITTLEQLLGRQDDWTK